MVIYNVYKHKKDDEDWSVAPAKKKMGWNTEELVDRQTNGTRCR